MTATATEAYCAALDYGLESRSRLNVDVENSDPNEANDEIAH
jgi:hypothetical protein